MSVCVVPFQVEMGRAFVGIGDGTATWAVTNSGNMACSCLCSCCHRGQSCGCIVGLIFILSVLVGSVVLSVVDAMELGEGLLAVGALETSCCRTGCLSCRGKQSTSLLLLLSSSGRLFSNRYADCFLRVLFVVRLRGSCVGLCVMAGQGNQIPWLMGGVLL